MNYEYSKMLNEIGEKEEISDKIKIAKKILTETEFLVNKDALYCVDYDNDKWSKEENYFKKFLEYKYGSKVYGDVDGDVSLLAVTMYALMNDKLKLEEIAYQNKSKCKYEIQTDKVRYRGDTLTSVITSLKQYLGFLWKKIEQDKKLQENQDYEEFYKLFTRVAYTGIPVVSKDVPGTWEQYCIPKSEIIWAVMDEPVKNFLKSCNKFGNFMCIPGCTYKVREKKYTSFNMARSNNGKWDTVDILLWKIYMYFWKKDENYLKAIFMVKCKEEELDMVELIKEELVKETVQWFKDMEFESWEIFVEKNCLEDFVDDESKIPLSMKTGMEISVDNEEYNALPCNYEESLVFFEQLSKRIDLRSKRILDCLEKKHSL